MFRDRAEAGRLLAEELSSGFAGASDVVVLGIPRGGVIVAAEVARRLGLPLDVVIACKIGAPGSPEYAVGAIDPDGVVTANPQARYSPAELEHMGRPVRERIVLREELYRGGRPVRELSGATVIVVDDGIATGLTARAALEYVRRKGAARVVLATPVIAPGSVAAFESLADEVVSVEEPAGFRAVGQFYRHFEQTSDDEVLSALAAVARDLP